MADERASDTWERGARYEQYVGRWSRRVAPLFLDWLEVSANRRWVDVGCGTGALCEAILSRCSPAAVIGIEPSQGFLETAAASLTGRATLQRGSATAIPLADASVDVVVSGLVLNFVATPQAALEEMARVVRNAGTIAAYVWDYAGQMELLRQFWDTAVELNPRAATLDEGVRFPLCHPERLRDLFGEAGLTKVAVTPIDIRTDFANFDDCWRPLLGGQGPAPTYVMSLTESERTRLRDHLRARLSTRADGSISLNARAWAVRAQRSTS